MKYLLLITALVLVSCNRERKETITPGGEVIPDSIIETKPEVILEEPPKIKTYSNERFKDVYVMGSPNGKYTVTGKAQVFEASFGWVVEDGHQELRSGHEMTNAGAPEWGNFRFEITVEKAQPNSVLHLILFESSAKDGSRQHELPIRLPG